MLIGEWEVTEISPFSSLLDVDEEIELSDLGASKEMPEEGTEETGHGIKIWGFGPSGVHYTKIFSEKFYDKYQVEDEVLLFCKESYKVNLINKDSLELIPLNEGDGFLDTEKLILVRSSDTHDSPENIENEEIDAPDESLLSIEPVQLDFNIRVGDTIQLKNKFIQAAFGAYGPEDEEKINGNTWTELPDITESEPSENRASTTFPGLVEKTTFSRDLKFVLYAQDPTSSRFRVFLPESYFFSWPSFFELPNMRTDGNGNEDFLLDIIYDKDDYRVTIENQEAFLEKVFASLDRITKDNDAFLKETYDEDILSDLKDLVDRITSKESLEAVLGTYLNQYLLLEGRKFGPRMSVDSSRTTPEWVLNRLINEQEFIRSSSRIADFNENTGIYEVAIRYDYHSDVLKKTIFPDDLYDLCSEAVKMGEKTTIRYDSKNKRVLSLINDSKMQVEATVRKIIVEVIYN